MGRPTTGNAAGRPGPSWQEAVKLEWGWLGPSRGVIRSVEVASLGPELGQHAEAEVRGMTTIWPCVPHQLVLREVLSLTASPDLSEVGLAGALERAPGCRTGSFLSSLHLLSQLPVRPGVCAGSQVPVLSPLPLGTFIGLTVPSSGSEGLEGVSRVWVLGQGSGPHLQPGGHLVPSGFLCLSSWPDDLPVIWDDLGVGV